MITSADLQNRMAAPESIRGESAVRAALHRVTGRRPVRAEMLDLADALDRAPRTGSEQDEPEGARMITMSDTVATRLAAALRKHAGRA